ncbi:MAG: type II toxin-antitoxin system prevent-host-death family antitoxin, partial [Micrococcales bacterium]|nr:type II toxin-antitoxin system prevent-host-death family antitoxin [Micrococcales bacterium]
MTSVSIRDLRNHGGDVLARVQRGESLTVTSSGRPVAQLVPLPAPPPTTDDLVARWRPLPPVNLDRLR